MQCKSLWIKASAKCINVNVNIYKKKKKKYLQVEVEDVLEEGVGL